MCCTVMCDSSLVLHATQHTSHITMHTCQQVLGFNVACASDAAGAWCAVTVPSGAACSLQAWSLVQWLPLLLRPWPLTFCLRPTRWVGQQSLRSGCT